MDAGPTQGLNWQCLVQKSSVRYTGTMTKQPVKSAMKTTKKPARFEPTKMALAVAAAAATTLVLFAVIATQY